jgi:Uma2 family endonuclease
MSTATRITVAEYDRMIADGKFEGGLTRPRVELIDGELREMSPIGSIHERLVARLVRWSCTNTAGDIVSVRPQSSIGIPDSDSVPEPDVVWAKEKDYGAGRPVGADILLVIEVSESSLAFGRGEKADMYASAGIADYWVVNIPGRCVEVFRQPEAGRYAVHEIIHASAGIHPLAFPEVALPVELLFPEPTP